MSAAINRDILSIFDCQLKDYETEVRTLQRIRSYDEYTYLHSLNVARLSINLGRRLGFSPEILTDLGWAALLHDIGKLHVPLEVLNKVKKFSAEELAVMQSHPAQALSAFAKNQAVTLDGLKRLSAAFEHHQRYDLKGYPTVHKKFQLHPFSRIVAIADTFDAMTTDRIYQRRVLPDVALKIMAQGFGTIFDPVILQAFITSMGAYPVGSLVTLSNQRLAVVIHYKENSTVDRPQVLTIKTPRADLLDLSAPENHSIRILRSEFAEDHDVDVASILEEWRKRL